VCRPIFHPAEIAELLTEARVLYGERKNGNRAAIVNAVVERETELRLICGSLFAV
jgi:hypothetical protein